MRKLTLAWIRREAWRILTTELTKISIVNTPDDCSAHSEYDDDEIEVWSDVYKTRLDHAVIHEILHKILDKYLEDKFTYHVYEYFITSLEKPFFKRMTDKEVKKWNNAIKAKIRHVDIKSKAKRRTKRLCRGRK